MSERIQPRCLCIGHGGASALAPANSLAGFDAALALGVDMVEFDVRAHGRRLLLAHTVLDARRRDPVTLLEALAHLAQPRFAALALNLDVKQVGIERALLEALADAGLTGRALISSQLSAVLDEVRRIEPTVRTGISVGGRLSRASRRWRQRTRRPVDPEWRAECLAGLERRRWDTLMIQHRLIDGELVSQTAASGGEIYAWTVNDRATVSAVRALGVHGITTADPRLLIDPARAAPEPQRLPLA